MIYCFKIFFTRFTDAFLQGREGKSRKSCKYFIVSEKRLVMRYPRAFPGK